MADHLGEYLFIFQAVLIDMEEGVVNETLNGPLRDIFDCKQLITDVSGCGNNWYISLYFYPVKQQFIQTVFENCYYSFLGQPVI